RPGSMATKPLEPPPHPLPTQGGASHTGATIALGPSEKSGGDRDFVLHYRLAGADLASGLLLYPGRPGRPGQPGNDESFFVMMAQPPHRPATELIPPREYVFILDVSGSMIGYPLDTAKHLMRDLLGRLRTSDRFNVLLSSAASSLYAEQSVEASKSQIDLAIKFIDAQNGGGG